MGSVDRLRWVGGWGARMALGSGGGGEESEDGERASSMQWFLRDGPRELVLSTETGTPLVGSVLVEEADAVREILRSASYDHVSMMVLREIHAELVEARNVREHADAVMLEDLLAEVVARRLFVFEQDHSVELLYEPVEMAEVVWQESEPLVVRGEVEAVSAVEVEVSAAVLAQVEALVVASAEGVAFCEI